MNVSPATLGGNSLVTSKITALKAGDFAGLSGVTKLDLHDNKITSFSRNMFTGLTSLGKLDLSMNRLDKGNVTLSSDVFADLTGLKKLNLWDNGLGSLPEGVFDDLTSLEELDVGSNWIVSGLYGDIFKDLSSLKVLKLNGAKAKDNGSRSLHRDLFDGLSNLEELNIGDNKLTSLHEDLFDGLSSLKTLSIRANEITSLPEGIFDDLDSLEYLYLHQNKIAALPDGIFEGLANLYRINMDGNTGAPFDVTVNLHEQEIDPDDDFNSREVFATVDSGAPFAITVTLEQLHNRIDYGDLGLLSTTTLTIPAGETKSNAAENYVLNSYYTVQYEIGSLSDWTAKATWEQDGEVSYYELDIRQAIPSIPDAPWLQVQSHLDGESRTGNILDRSCHTPYTVRIRGYKRDWSDYATETITTNSCSHSRTYHGYSVLFTPQIDLYINVEQRWRKTFPNGQKRNTFTYHRHTVMLERYSSFGTHGYFVSDKFARTKILSAGNKIIDIPTGGWREFTPPDLDATDRIQWGGYKYVASDTPRDGTVRTRAEYESGFTLIPMGGGAHIPGSWPNSYTLWLR